MTRIWDRQPQETPKAFAAFCVYREQPADERSLERACIQSTGSKGTLRRWAEWSTKNGWVNRAAEHDSDLASRRRERRARELDKAMDDQAILSTAVLQRLGRAVNVLAADSIPVGIMSQLMRVAADIQLRALGHEATITVNGVPALPSAIDLSLLTDDQLRNLAEIKLQLAAGRNGEQEEEGKEQHEE